ncbi:IclR family transcriptional regulator [Bacillus sp. Marseille-P3661]|uniref:IclR family transcriptional regulator n=1 Tax=Bacillus sp. Marseille-P3661 TaxID=1936234 RepID=UPI000C82EA10|nr:IclR family transcriptional regulator [Bacillus sp. Marseille-P3661]
MINSIKHAIRIVDCFNEEHKELGVTDIATKLDMNISTVHHVVSTLYEEDILVKTQTRRYRLGSKLIKWGRSVSTQYEPFFMTIPYIEALVNRVNESVYLTIMENNEVSYLAKVEAFKPTNIVTNIGLRNRLCSTASGKAMLAFQSQKMIDKFLSNSSNYNTTHENQTSKETLLLELQKIRRLGYALNNGEFKKGYFSVAAPITNYLGDVVCAITVDGPEKNIRANLNNILESLQKTAKLISRDCDLN